MLLSYNVRLLLMRHFFKHFYISADYITSRKSTITRCMKQSFKVCFQCALKKGHTINMLNQHIKLKMLHAEMLTCLLSSKLQVQSLKKATQSTPYDQLLVPVKSSNNLECQKCKLGFTLNAMPLLKSKISSIVKLTNYFMTISPLFLQKQEMSKQIQASNLHFYQTHN